MEIFDFKTVLETIADHDLDYIVLIALQNKSADYSEFFSIVCKQSERGVYVIYSNCLSLNPGRSGVISDGRSSVYGHLDNMWKADLLNANYTDNYPETKLLQLGDTHNYMIVGLDIDTKKPTRPIGKGNKPNVFCQKFDSCNTIIRKSKTALNRKYINKLKSNLVEQCMNIDLTGLSETEEIATRHFSLDSLFIQPTFSPLLGYSESRGHSVQEKAYAFRTRVSDERMRQATKPLIEVINEAGPLSQYFHLSKRLVILGAPGSGKSILAQWLGLAYALRRSSWDDVDLRGASALPDVDLLPIQIRCRDYRDGLGNAIRQGDLPSLCVALASMEGASKSEVAEFRKHISELLDLGKALVLVDGLDEIESAEQREQMCGTVQKWSQLYPDSWFVLTSRVKGYRDLSKHVGNGFTHLQINALRNDDKIEFAKRWCNETMVTRRAKEEEAGYVEAVTQPTVSALTDNPMLLTNICLLRRSRTKLPNRRSDIYYECVKLLFNRRGGMTNRIDYSAGVSHLMYLSYHLCNEGKYQVNMLELESVVNQFRNEYDTIENTKYEVGEFVSLIESQTGLLLETGRERHGSGYSKVFEFKHRTFQEYFAGIAIERGKCAMPGAVDFVSRVRQLTADLDMCDRTVFDGVLLEYRTIKERWHEPLLFALLSADYKALNDAVRMVLLNVDGRSEKALVVFMAECLAEDPKELSGQLAGLVLKRMIDCVSREDCLSPEINTVFDAAVVALTQSGWGGRLTSGILEKIRGGGESVALLRLHVAVQDGTFQGSRLGMEVKEFETLEGRIDYAARCVGVSYKVLWGTGGDGFPGGRPKSTTSLLKRWWREDEVCRGHYTFALAWICNAMYQGAGLVSVREIGEEWVYVALCEAKGDVEFRYALAIATKPAYDMYDDDDSVLDWAVRLDGGPLVGTPRKKQGEIDNRIWDLVRSRYTKMDVEGRRSVALRMAAVGCYDEMFADELVNVLLDAYYGSTAKGHARRALGHACTEIQASRLLQVLANEAEELSGDAALILVGLQFVWIGERLIEMMELGKLRKENLDTALRVLGNMKFNSEMKAKFLAVVSQTRLIDDSKILDTVLGWIGIVK